MTLDCFIYRSSSFFTNSDHPQSRVISVQSWYLTSISEPLFLRIWLSFLILPLLNSLHCDLISFHDRLFVEESLPKGFVSASLTFRFSLCFSAALLAFWLHYNAQSIILQDGIVHKVYNVNIVWSAESDVLALTVQKIFDRLKVLGCLLAALFLIWPRIYLMKTSAADIIKP